MDELQSAAHQTIVTRIQSECATQRAQLEASNHGMRSMKRAISFMREDIFNLRERATELQEELDEAKRCHVGEVSRTMDQYETELSTLRTASSELTSEVQHLRSKLKDATRQVVEETRARARSPHYSPYSLGGNQEGEENREREKVEINISPGLASPSEPRLGRTEGSSSAAELSSPSTRSPDFPTSFSTPGYSDFQSMENAARRRVIEREERGQRLASLQHRLDSSAADLRKEVAQRHSPLVSPVMVDDNGSKSPPRNLHSSSTTTMSDELGQELVEAEALAKSARKRIEAIQVGVRRVQKNAASLNKISPTQSTSQKTRRRLHAIESKHY